ncbi:MAG: hypothetical protein CVT49_11795 [candidate division Zixibacteria bacterium HGW-Zixibacteria-1]|nr:MAG: hypothetical protein CVT49_11795 [candidate division Zixibacteria bacterium HGW-Zixibacteria-1]
MDIKVRSLTEETSGDYFRLHSDDNKHGWCYCVAWWVPTWEGWSQRSIEDNRSMREHLFRIGEYDGYLMYDGDEPIGWCQAGPRDRLVKLITEYRLPYDSDIWAITCFFIITKYRDIGLGQHMLKEILEDLRKKGVRYVQGFPRRGKNLKVDDLWTGPENFFVNAGFNLERDDPNYPIYGLKL